MHVRVGCRLPTVTDMSHKNLKTTNHLLYTVFEDKKWKPII
jgi:hypothetical protein